MAISCLVNDPGYCAIGFSVNGSMIYGNGTDAIVVSPDTNGSSEALDFFMTAQLEPGNGSCPLGVCPDSDTLNCVNNVFNVTGNRLGMYIVVQFSRPIMASDTCDRTIDVNGITNDSLIWAWGNGTLPASILTHSILNRGAYSGAGGPRFPWNFGSTGSATTTGSLTTALMTTTGIMTTTGNAASTTASMSTSGTTSGSIVCGNMSCSTSNPCETPTCSVYAGTLLCTYPNKADNTNCTQIDSGNNYCYTGACQTGICQFAAICAQTASSSRVAVPIVVLLLIMGLILVV